MPLALGGDFGFADGIFHFEVKLLKPWKINECMLALRNLTQTYRKDQCIPTLPSTPTPSRQAMTVVVSSLVLTLSHSEAETDSITTHEGSFMQVRCRNDLRYPRELTVQLAQNIIWSRYPNFHATKVLWRYPWMGIGYPNIYTLDYSVSKLLRIKAVATCI